jgi:hypothetical protein
LCRREAVRIRPAELEKEKREDQKNAADPGGLNRSELSVKNWRLKVSEDAVHKKVLGCNFHFLFLLSILFEAFWEVLKESVTWE